MPISSRDVFIVHGRNLAVRDAVAAFLRALDLNPIEWEDASAMTGAATPRTMENVRRGLGCAQAVVVLMTGDDLVRLRPELGHEPPSCQPRPNVLLEAGMAIAGLGEERVLFVTLGAVREISDLAGLNYLELNNSGPSRQAFANRLQTAGCAIKVTGGTYLDPLRGGDFEVAVAAAANAPPAILQRGDFDDYLVDSTISYTVNNIELLHELQSHLTNPGASDLKYSYLGVSGATNWLTLSQEDAYAATDPRQLILKALPDLFGDTSISGRTIDLISLGPGDGALDARMIGGLAKFCTIKNYYPLDISVELLQQTVKRTSYVCRSHGIQMKAIQGDFLELRHYRPVFAYDDAVNVVALVGYTLGNYNEGELLGKVREALNAGDFLLVDARLHDYGKDVSLKALRSEGETITRSLNNGSNNRFAFGPVEMATTAEFSTANFDLRISRDYTAVHGAYNVVTACRGLRARIRGSNKAIAHEKLDLAVTTFYDPDCLLEFIVDRGFSVVAKRADKHALALLLRKE